MKGTDIAMKPLRYIKPNMTRLKGNWGRSIINQIKNNIVPSDENIRKEAEACKRRILAKRADEK